MLEGDFYIRNEVGFEEHRVTYKLASVIRHQKRHIVFDRQGNEVVRDAQIPNDVEKPWFEYSIVYKKTYDDISSPFYGRESTLEIQCDQVVNKPPKQLLPIDL